MAADSTDIYSYFYIFFNAIFQLEHFKLPSAVTPYRLFGRAHPRVPPPATIPLPAGLWAGRSGGPAPTPALKGPTSSCPAAPQTRPGGRRSPFLHTHLPVPSPSVPAGSVPRGGRHIPVPPARHLRGPAGGEGGPGTPAAATMAVVICFR